MIALFEMFTRDADVALKQAREATPPDEGKIITPLHLLVGLLELQGSQAETHLREMGLKPMLIKNQALALIKMAAKEGSLSEVGYKDRQIRLSTDAVRVLEAAQAEAEEQAVNFIDTRVLLLGMLRDTSNAAGDLLRQYGMALDEFRLRARLAEVGPVNVPRNQWPGRADVPAIRPSPVFLGLIVLTALLGALLYAQIGPPTVIGLSFILAGSIVCLAVHEFGHAIAAYVSGDKSVVDKGYLTLNPAQYMHPFLSIVLPLVFLLMGGLPLPGGAVYIDRAAIRGTWRHVLVSAAGPLGTLLCVIVLGLPFMLGWYRVSVVDHPELWAVLAVLLYVEVAALFLNLIPIPGLDGFNIIEPFLPESVVVRLYPLRAYTFFILIILFRAGTLMDQYFWPIVIRSLILIQPHVLPLIGRGFEICLPWLN